MNFVYICSPYSGNVEENVLFAREMCRRAILQGYIPIAPHLYFTRFLDDNVPEQRKAGIEMGIRLIKFCEEIWVCGDRTSPGMAAEIAEAAKLGVKRRYVRD